jgi:nucleoside-diphosphate kinase
MQRTLFIVKPNATEKNRVGAVINLLEEGGLRVAGLRMLRLQEKQAKKFYEVHKERPFYESLVRFMCSGPVVVGVLEGENAIERCRNIMGATDPAKAEKGTIRALYGESIQNNAIHGSDSDENAAKEVSFFFPELG